jgi:sarcosine oxidase subunit beta
VSGGIVIVGGGLEGLSIARALTSREAGPVTVLERDELAAAMTSKSSGIIRCHYGVPSLAAMAWQSLPVLRDLGADAGFRQTGYVVGVGDADVAALQANVAMQQAVGVDVGLVDHDAVAAMWPVANLADFAAFAYEPQGGYGDGYLTAQAFGRQARAAGASIRTHSPVATVHTGDGGVTGVVLADGTTLPATAVIVAAGPWTPALVAPLGVDIPVQAQRAQIIVVEPGSDLGPIPVFSDLVSLQYVRPEGRGSILVGSSDHHRPEWADPDSYANRVDEDFLLTAVTKLDHRFPKLTEPELSSSYSGCYDTTPDYNPVLSDTAVSGLYLAAGFSGHGYKISPAVGDLVADLVLEGGSDRPDIHLSDFRLSRFAEDRPLRSLHPYAEAGEMR